MPIAYHFTYFPAAPPPLIDLRFAHPFRNRGAPVVVDATAPDANSDCFYLYKRQ